MENEKLKKILKENNVSVTSVRESIFETLLRSDGPLKKSEIAAQTRNVNRASVYRTLDLFENLGITTSMIRGWTPFIELADPFKPHHHHLQCIRCGQLIALDTPELEKLVEALASAHNYTLTAHHIELSGFCLGCQSNNQ